MRSIELAEMQHRPLGLPAAQGRLIMAPQVDLMVKALSDAQGVVAAYRAAERPDAKAAVNSLIIILEDRKLMAVVRAVIAASL